MSNFRKFRLELESEGLEHADDLDVAVAPAKVRLAPPSMYQVLLLNDDFTPMDFVIEILTSVFRHSPETARDITMDIHESGSSVAGIYTYEIAEQKGIEVTLDARSKGYPLQIKVEAELE